MYTILKNPTEIFRLFYVTAYLHVFTPGKLCKKKLNKIISEWANQWAKGRFQK